MNKIFKSFDEIHAPENLKSTTLYNCTKKRNHFNFYQITAACIAAVLFAGSTYIFHATTSEAAYISIDVNPSIGLSLNHFKRIISVDSYNDEADKLISTLDLKGEKYNNAINNLLMMENSLGYDIKNVEIYIESKYDKLSSEISSSISIQCPYANLSCPNETNKQEAAEYNISPGKYYLIKQIIQYGGTIEEYKSLPMKELKRIYEQYSGDAIVNDEQNNRKNNGNHNKFQLNENKCYN